MKSVVRSLILASASTLCMPAAMFAATTTNPPAVVSSGTFTLQLDSSFVSSLKDQGIQTTYVANESSSRDTPIFNVGGGVVDLTSGSSEVLSNGGVTFTSSNEQVTLEDLSLESTDTSRAHVTALVIVNGTLMGRHPVFTVTSGAAFTFPLKFGGISSTPITFKVDPQFANEINDYFQVSGGTYKGMVGQFTLNLLLSPQK